MQHSGTRRATRILVALAVLAAGVIIAPPAEATVPSRTPEATLKCKNGKKAKIWWQCKEWLYFDIRTSAESESDCCHGVQVAPGATMVGIFDISIKRGMAYKSYADMICDYQAKG